MAYLLGEPTVQQYFDVNGDPLVNGSVEFYVTGTSTPTSVYSDDIGTAIGTSVTLNTLGAPENSGTAVALFFDDQVTYKIIRKDASGTPIPPTIDPYKVNVAGESSAFSMDVIATLQANTNSILTRVALAGHTTEGDGGGGPPFWFDPSDTTTADDNGINIVDSQSPRAGTWKRLFSGTINVKWFGAVGDGVADDTAAFVSALAKNIPLYIPEGIYKITSQLTIASGTVITGSASENYGEFDTKYPSMLRFEGLAPGTWCMQIDSANRGISFRHFAIQGDWAVNGIDFVGGNREIDLIDFSIQKMLNGIQTDDAWVCVFDRMSITARGTGIKWGSGTTNKWTSIRMQGDKDNSILMERGWHFTTGKLQNSSISGFCQLAKIGMYLEGSPQLEIHSFDWEGCEDDCIVVDSTDEMRLSIDSCSALLPLNSSFMRFTGVVLGATKIYIKNLTGFTKHFSGEFYSSLDWTTEKFLEDDSATISAEATIEIRYDFYNTVKDGIDAGIKARMVKALQVPSDFKLANGTFTPTVSGGTVAGSGSYSTRDGSYYRIGNMVHISLTVAWSGHTGTGELRIGNLPYTASETSIMSPYNFQLPFANDYLTARLGSTSDYFTLYDVLAGNFGSTLNMDAAATVTISGVYVTDQ